MAYYDKNEVLAQALLDAVVGQFVTEDLPLPAFRVLGYAGMPMEVDMLTVQLVRMYSVAQQTGPEAESTYAHRPPLWRGAEFDVVCIRCTPQPKVVGADNVILPSKNEIEAFARIVLRDPLVMTRGILLALRGGAYGEIPNLAFADSATIADESGGIVGIRLRVRIGTVL